MLLVSICAGCHSDLHTIRIASSYEIQTLDPHVKYTLSHAAVQFNFYEGLVSTDAEMNIHPCLATRWENPDAYTWVFHLNPSVHFHDGKKLTAEDVIYTFKRLLGSNDLDAASSITDVVDVKEIDPLTVQMRTFQPLTVFLNKLSLVAIIANGSKPESLAAGENGTGPFRLVHWIRGDRVEMERFEEYWGERPYLKHVTMFLGRSPEQAFESLNAGTCEMAQCNAQELESRIDTKRFNILIHDGLFVKYLAFDTTRDSVPGCSLKENPFKNRLVRQAIHLAIQRQDLVTRIPAHAAPANQVVPELIFGFNPQLPPAGYDPQTAKDLLAQAGLSKGFEVTLHSRKILESTAVVIKEYLQRIGIRVDLAVLPDNDFFNALRTGKSCFMLSRMGATVGDASDVLESAIHSPDQQRHYGSMNYLGYSNPEIDRLTEEAAAQQLPERRQTVLQQAMTVVMQDLPWIPLYIDQDVYALDKRYSWKPRLDSSIFAAEFTAAK